MVGILSSLKTTFGHEPAGPDIAKIAPRSVAPLHFLRPMRRQKSGADLARMIEGEIIPRLMLAHRPPASSDPAVASGAIAPQALDAFVAMTLSNEVHALSAYVEALLQSGVSLDTVYVDLLIPTARRLGDDWNEDVISFTDVTIGLARLQQLVRILAHDIPSRDADAGARSAYFIAAPNEQHAFGLVILEDYFRRAGWRTWLDTTATCEEAVRTVGHDWFDVFGISATSDTPTQTIASTIARVRKASRNPNLFVMAGGRLFIEDPALTSVVGADASSETAGDALIIADKAIRPVAFA